MRTAEHFDKCIILHGCPPSEEMITPKENRWMNWLAEELNKRGISAIAPDMPPHGVHYIKNGKKNLKNIR